MIVDRIGLSIELVPHVFGTNHRPTGQRGLYAFWRNGSKVIDAARSASCSASRKCATSTSRDVPD